ncbi:VOC family protein [Konateibacter massiliensis]|uniref:VOC family protein n=1 Tax=Konateibacter massiliensis TaxID=2002841 RepID=UPI00117A777C|nr:VOC family protein [Konateibacter massiliensis]
MQIGTGLYVKNSIEAVELYKEVFGLELGYHVKNPDGSYFHSELYKDGQEFLSVVESSDRQPEEHVVHLGVSFESEADVQKAYALLSEGGTIKIPIGPLPWTPCAAEVIDRFGVWWYITAPQHRPPDDYDPEAPWDASMYKKV